MTIAAANPSGGAAIGMGLGAGAAIGQVMAASLKTAGGAPAAAPAAAPTAAPAASTQDTKFCIACGHSIPQRASFCPDCGKAQ